MEFYDVDFKDSYVGEGSGISLVIFIIREVCVVGMFFMVNVLINEFYVKNVWCLFEEMDWYGGGEWVM